MAENHDPVFAAAEFFDGRFERLARFSRQLDEPRNVEGMTLSDAQDAARYRALKQRMKSHSVCDGVQFETWFDTEDHDLDAAIDDAILAQHDGRKAEGN